MKLIIKYILEGSIPMTIKNLHKLKASLIDKLIYHIQVLQRIIRKSKIANNILISPCLN